MQVQHFRSHAIRLRATLCAALLLAAAVSAPSTVDAKRPATTALDRYVKTPDPAYKFSVVSSQKADGYTVDLIEMTPEGTISQFTVKYGMLGRHSKRLPADVITGVSGNDVNVTIDQQEFKMLADVGEDIV